MRNYFIIGLVVMLSACAGTMTTKDNIYKPETVTVNKNAAILKLKFKRGLLSDEAIKQMALRKIKDQLKTYEKSLPSPRFDRSALDSSLSILEKFTHKQNSNTNIVERKSLKVISSDQYLEVNILSGEYMGRRKGEAKISIKYDVAFTTDNSFLYLSIFYPRQYTKQKGNMGSQGPALPLFSDSDMPAVIDALYKLMGIEQIDFADKHRYSGELVAGFSDDAIYANFLRKHIGRTNDKTKIKKVAIIPIMLGTFNGNATVEVYPYQDKSKITYSLELKQTIKLFSNGEYKFIEYPSPSDVKNIISNIANE